MISADPANVIAAALDWVGTPYHDQASVKGAGCDCLGLARGVWRDVVGPEPEKLPAYSRDWGEVNKREVLIDGAGRWMIPVTDWNIQPGDLLLFRMRRGAIAKHCGILIAPDLFVHAYDRLGVIEDHMTRDWTCRIAYAFRYPEGPR